MTCGIKHNIITTYADNYADTIRVYNIICIEVKIAFTFYL